MKLSDTFYNKRLQQQNNRCYYCGDKLIRGYKPIGNIEIDHIKPHSKYKDGTRGNLCLACVDCNQKKLDHELNRFRELCLLKYPHKLDNNLFYFESNKIIL
jgi:5-methylcytosine-specific restriction endonuclease McrA